MTDIRLIEKDTILPKLRPYDWDVYINDKPYYVVRIEGFVHTIGGKYGENDLWAYPRDEEPTYENLIEFNCDNPVSWGIEYKPRNYDYKDFISQEEFLEYIKKADIVVTHGASGSIMKALNEGKKVIVVTRLEKYGEHINDHQIQNNEAFSSNHYVLMADLELNNLGECFKKIKSKNNGLVKWENKDPMSIVNLIDKFIQDNWE